METLTLEKSLDIVNNYRPRSRFQLFPPHAPRSCKQAIILHKIDISRTILDEIKEDLNLAIRCINTINLNLIISINLDEIESLKFGLTSGNNMIKSLNKNHNHEHDF